MSSKGILELLRAHLCREGLMLCRGDGGLLEGANESAALRELADLANAAATTPDFDEWAKISASEDPARYDRATTEIDGVDYVEDWGSEPQPLGFPTTVSSDLVLGAHIDW